MNVATPQEGLRTLHQLSEIEKEYSIEGKINSAKINASIIANEDAECCKRIGQHGLKLIKDISKNKNNLTLKKIRKKQKELDKIKQEKIKELQNIKNKKENLNKILHERQDYEKEGRRTSAIHCPRCNRTDVRTGST